MSSHHDKEKRIAGRELAGMYQAIDRRNFLNRTAMGLGAIALQQLFSPVQSMGQSLEEKVVEALPLIAPRARRVVYLFMAGGPSQFETFDYKPRLKELYGSDLPDSIRKGQRLTSMSANQAILPVVPSFCNFKQYGLSLIHI